MYNVFVIVSKLSAYRKKYVKKLHGATQYC